MQSEGSLSAPNSAQAEYWNTAVGHTWAEYHDQLDRQIGSLGNAALAALAPAAGERVLDVGCGCGHTTADIAGRVGASGSVLGVDLSAPMLEIARRRPLPPGAGHIEFRQLDAQTADLGRSRFDAAYSRFGVMFFSDPVAAFTNVRRALKPGGRLGFVCWQALDANPWVLEPLEAARPLLPPLPAPDPTAPGPFAFADDRRVRAVLGAAGFTDISVQPFTTRIGGGDLDDALQLALRVGPLGAAIREQPSLAAGLVGPVRAVLAKHVTPVGVFMAAAVWIVHASTVGDPVPAPAA